MYIDIHSRHDNSTTEDNMQTIKQAYQAGNITAMQAAKELSRWNGNPLAGNWSVVQGWSRARRQEV